MAQIRLEQHEAEAGCLPPVCLRCGAPATCLRERRFERGGRVQSWVVAPLCSLHRWHWSARDALVRLTAIALLFALCAGLFTLAEHPRLAVALLVGSLAAWAALALVLHWTAIRAKPMTDAQLTLVGAAESFAAALAEHRKSPARGRPLELPGGDRQRTIRLTAPELEGALPAVCLRCGAPATCWNEASLDAAAGAWVVFFFLFRMGAAAHGHLPDDDDKPLLSIKAPLCDAHRRHWAWWAYVVPGALAALIALTAAGGWASTVGLVDSIYVWLGILTGFVAWLALAITVRGSMIRRRGTEKPPTKSPESIRWVTLVGVSGKFCTALERHRRGNKPISTSRPAQ